MDNKDSRRRVPQFELSAGVNCLDFINTLDDRPTGQPKELLTSYAALVRFGEDTGILDSAQITRLSQHSVDQAQRALRRAIELREALYHIFSAVVNRKLAPPEATQTLNHFLRAARDHSQLVERNGRFIWEFADRFSCDVVTWALAQSAAGLLVSDQLEFVRTCSSETCQWFFLDTSKNHRRRWCNMQLCGNRAKVRRFYDRQKTSG
ncbi:MAG TPA: ABATE domain-containing protein [Candidatus Sulfotelmatobacter sp.]